SFSAQIYKLNKMPLNKFIARNPGPDDRRARSGTDPGYGALVIEAAVVTAASDAAAIIEWAASCANAAALQRRIASYQISGFEDQTRVAPAGVECETAPAPTPRQVPTPTPTAQPAATELTPMPTASNNTVITLPPTPMADSRAVAASEEKGRGGFAVGVGVGF
ncbi:unnamed protein product, partial [Phaeothamnion confervicola]